MKYTYTNPCSFFINMRTNFLRKRSHGLCVGFVPRLAEQAPACGVGRHFGKYNRLISGSRTGLPSSAASHFTSTVGTHGLYTDAYIKNHHILRCDCLQLNTYSLRDEIVGWKRRQISCGQPYFLFRLTHYLSV